MVVFLILAGIGEGMSILSLLPLLGLLIGEGGGDSGAQELIGRLFDSLGLHLNIPNLLLLMVLGALFKAGLTVLAGRQVGYATAEVGADMRSAVIRHILAARWSHFLTQPVGKVANAISSEVPRAGSAFLAMGNLISAATRVLVYLGSSLLVSWPVTLIALAAGAGMMGFLWPTVVHVRVAGLEMTRALRALTGRFVDGLQGVKPLKAMARQEQLARLLEDENRILQRTQQKRVLHKWLLKAGVEPIVVVLIASGVYLGTELRLATVSSLMVVALLFARTLSQMGTVQQAMLSLGDCESAFTALHKTIDDARAACEVTGGESLLQLRHEVQLDSVTFSYGGKPILDRVKICVPARGVTLLVGPSGVGKSTVADLVIGLLKPDAGSIRVDGKSLADADLATWRSQIGYVPQDLFLFHDDLRDNVTLGDTSHSEQDIVGALTKAGAWDFVGHLEGGLSARLGERGQSLSGGQRQRVAIARAIIRKPNLLILDEPTSALDEASANDLYATLEALGRDTAVLLISHDENAASIADHIYRFTDGLVQKAT